MHPGRAFARGGAIRGAAIGGLGGAALGAAIGGLPKTQKSDTGKIQKLTGDQRKKKALLGALGMGMVGASQGHSIGWDLRAAKWNKGFRPPSARPDWLKGATTRAEGRKAFHAQARKHHPDLGGSEEAIKKLNKEWEMHEPHFKTAMYAAFADELEKIASLGALIGGYAGHRMSGKDMKSQAMGIAGGALAGHLVGKGLGAAKQEIIDRPAERERAELYGYVQPPPPTNFR